MAARVAPHLSKHLQLLCSVWRKAAGGWQAWLRVATPWFCSSVAALFKRTQSPLRPVNCQVYWDAAREEGTYSRDRQRWRTHRPRQKKSYSPHPLHLHARTSHPPPIPSLETGIKTTTPTVCASDFDWQAMRTTDPLSLRRQNATLVSARMRADHPTPTLPSHANRYVTNHTNMRRCNITSGVTTAFASVWLVVTPVQVSDEQGAWGRGRGWAGADDQTAKQTSHHLNLINDRWLSLPHLQPPPLRIGHGDVRRHGASFSKALV